MADQQPGDVPPAAAMPDPTRFHRAGEPPTATAPARWSGSAAVPARAAKPSRWALLRARPRRGRPAVDRDDWAPPPPVDPWAGQDCTPWDAMPVVPETPPPPTRVEPVLPTTRIEPPPPPTRIEPPAPRPPAQRTPAPRTAPSAAPPPWVPAPPSRAAAHAQRPLPPTPRPRRRRGRRLALPVLLGALLCGYYAFPTARQYPVSAALPQSFADLRLRDEDAGRRATGRLADQLRDADPDDVFAGVYGDSRGKRVTVFGVTGWRFAPGRDVRGQLDRLADDFDLRDVQSYDIGESGVHEQCGVGRSAGTTLVVCAWADHGSLATVLLTRRSVDDSAELVSRLRTEVLRPG